MSSSRSMRLAYLSPGHATPMLSLCQRFTKNHPNENLCAMFLRPLLTKRSGPTCDAITKPALNLQPSDERMKIMVTDTSATVREETPHASETASTISNALRRRAQSIMNDIWIDREWRSIIRYALETNDPWLGDLVRRADAGEMIVDTIDFSETPEVTEGLSAEANISALCEIICQAGAEPAAALFVLMGRLEHSSDPRVIANTAKHRAFSRCADLNVYGIVDAQVDLLEAELLTTGFGSS